MYLCCSCFILFVVKNVNSFYTALSRQLHIHSFDCAFQPIKKAIIHNPILFIIEKLLLNQNHKLKHHKTIKILLSNQKENSPFSQIKKKKLFMIFSDLFRIFFIELKYNNINVVSVFFCLCLLFFIVFIIKQIKLYFLSFLKSYDSFSP
jgi:hypothetical protein